MKSVKRKLTMFLAILLIMSGMPVFTNTVPAQEEVINDIYYNTGSMAVKVVDESELDDLCDSNILTDIFDENGNYTINISEANPFFPYEVQFTCNGEKRNVWFMSPDDSVEIGGHTFYVSAYMDGTQVTQMSLDVGGKEVIVYPEAKEFTNPSENGDMIEISRKLSLLPLAETRLTVDLSAFNPLELSMIKVKTILQGTTVADNAAVAWVDMNYGENDFDVTGIDDSINLSDHTSYNTYKNLQLIVGDGDQLNPDNLRYIISARITRSEDWLMPTVYTQTKDINGNIIRNKIGTIDNYTYYSDSSALSVAYQDVGISSEDVADKDVYVGFDAISVTEGGYVKVFQGTYNNASEAERSTELTDKFFCADMSQNDSGLKKDGYYHSIYLTMVAYSADGEVMGCLPMSIYFRTTNTNSGSISFGRLYEKTDTGEVKDVTLTRSTTGGNNSGTITYKVYEEYPLNGTYYTYLYYQKAGTTVNDEITAVFQGTYESIAEAVAAGERDIKSEILTYAGFEADFSKEVHFTIFIGPDSEEGREVYHYQLKTEESGVSKNTSSLHDGTAVTFTGLVDAGSNNIKSHVSQNNNDSYGVFSIILVGEDADLTNIAPVFKTSEGVNLYAAGSSSPEVSGESYHDFSNGPVQYTASAENGSDSANYWLYIVKASSAEGAKQLYISSLSDSSSKTTQKDGIIYTNREIMLDSVHDGNLHNILLTNIGTTAIPNLSVELDSDVVELDDYWTLHGNFELSGFNTIEGSTSYSELPNFAKIVLKKKGGVANGTDVSGTLTIKSGDTALIVMNLTGTVGNPSIVTNEIPGAVKYVPYGTMIQNNNKYSWNKVTYELYSGTLPEGMIIKPNGELYGVPREAGEFMFTVRMTNSYTGFSSSSQTFTLHIAENTDENVDNATDTGYELKERITNVESSGSYLIVSTGIFPEFQDIYLDGVKLQEGKDYEAESGSTRVTIKGQTLSDAGEGTHTLGMEFRETESGDLKRAAQNYTIGETEDDSDDEEDDSIDYLNAAADSNEIYQITYLGNGSMYVTTTHRTAKAYDISLIDESTAFPITIVMTAPSGMDMTKTKILHLNAQNGIDETFYYGNGFTYNPANNTVAFTVNHFSKFIFVEEGAAPLTADDTPLKALPVLFMLSAAGMFIAMYNNKKKSCFSKK